MIKKIVFCLAVLVSLNGQESVSDSISSFSFSMFSKAQKPGENTVFSPYSIFTCLAMPYMGAKGATADAIENALHISMPPNDVAAAISSSLNTYSQEPEHEKEYQLHVANSVWVAPNFSILSDYHEILAKSFQAGIWSIDFKQSDFAASTINGWISSHTQGKIPNLLSPESLSAATRLLLANAIYFKGSWASPFETDRTELGPFQIDEDTWIQTPLMNQTANLPYFETEDFQIVALPFLGKKNSPKIAYVMALPKNGYDLTNLKEELNAASFQNWISSLARTKVHVKCPKFVLDEKLSLNSILSRLGMGVAFSSHADFSGIDGNRDLSIDQALHQAFFSVDENGVTAAAATALSISFTSIDTRPERVIEFIATHPFLFFLVDMNAKTPLFMGMLNQPICE